MLVYFFKTNLLSVLSIYQIKKEMFYNRAKEQLKMSEVHSKMHPDIPVRSIAFDRETSVMSKKVQAYFAGRGIAFHAFKMSSSKAKFAEGAIRQIREVMQRLMQRGQKKDRWWNLLPKVIDNLNNQENLFVWQRV